jgi:pyridoxine kinase
VNILSIQSWVSYGHVGNASAVFPLQRLGAEVWAINTVQFSNHTGYGDWKGEVYSGQSVRDLVDGIAARNAFKRCNAVLTGYVGGADIGEAILHAVASVRRANPRALYCCDPVIGDADTGVYVQPGIEAFLRTQALPIADIATPNQFEIERLTGLDCSTLHGAKQAVLRLRSMLYGGGPACVLLTSLDTDSTPADCIDMMTFEQGTFYASAAGERQRGGGCDRGFVSVSPATDRERSDGVGGCWILSLWSAAADGGGGLERNPHGRGTR